MFFIAMFVTCVFILLALASMKGIFGFFGIISLVVGTVFAVVAFNSNEPIKSYESGLLAENPAGEYVNSDGYFVEAGDNRVELVKIEGSESSVNVTYVTIPDAEEPHYEINGEIYDNWISGFGEEGFTPKEYVFYVNERGILKSD